MHLALSVWEETYPFGSLITTEGKEINSLYAIKSGVVKLSVDPSRDVPNEVLNLITPPQNHLADILSQTKQVTSEESERQRILGPGDYVGSIEALLSIKISNFTAMCDSPVTVYCLDHVNFQIWITKRYISSARHMHLTNRTILVEWADRLRGAAILSCLLALTNQELTRLNQNLGKRKYTRNYGVIRDGCSPKQLALTDSNQ